MQDLMQFIRDVEDELVFRIIVALLIILLFWLLSESISYVIIKILKIREKNSKKIKQNAFYNPLKIFFKILGIYTAVLYLSQRYNIKSEIMTGIIKAFQIITTIVFARGIAESFSDNSILVKKIRNRSTKKVDDAMLNTILKLIRGIIYICAGILIITELGFNLNGIIAGLGIGGVILTLAAQDTAKNLFGGAVIFIDKPFLVGDWIQVEDFEGTVEDITFRSTRIRTFENSLVNIPNAIIADASVINWSKMEKRRYKTKLCLELNTPLQKVQELMDSIKKILLKHEQIEDETIIVRFEAITDNGIQIMISSYTDSVNYKSYLEEIEIVNYKIMQIVREQNINLAYDTKTVYVKK